MRPRLRAHPALLTIAAVAALMAPLATSNTNLPWFLCEFRGDLYNAGHAIIDGNNPYQAAYVAHVAAVKRAGGRPKTNFIVPVYPAFALIASVPFALLPFHLASMLYLLFSIAALMVALRLLEVTDIRCLGLMIASVPVLMGLIDGAVTPLLVLGVAAAWRYRDHVWRLASPVAVVVAAKVFLCPLMVWMFITRRLRSLVVALGLVVALIFAAWAVIGFAGLTTYPRMLQDLTYVEESVGVSFVAVLHAAGLSTGVAHVLALAATGGLLAAAWAVFREPDGEKRAFGLAVMAALTASPIAWANYVALVFVPIALVSPRLSALWLVPLIAYLAPETQTHGNLLEMLPYLGIELIVTARLLWTKPLRMPQVTAREVPAPHAAA
jgi:Glycosyltransferase family 87